MQNTIIIENKIIQMLQNSCISLNKIPHENTKINNAINNMFIPPKVTKRFKTQCNTQKF